MIVNDGNGEKLFCNWPLWMAVLELIKQLCLKINFYINIMMLKRIININTIFHYKQRYLLGIQYQAFKVNTYKQSHMIWCPSAQAGCSGVNQNVKNALIIKVVNWHTSKMIGGGGDCWQVWWWCIIHYNNFL